MSVETVTRSVLRQGLTYSTFWPGALAQQDTSERRTENLLYGNMYCTAQITRVTFLKKKISAPKIYCTILYGTIGHNPPTKLTNACFTYDVLPLSDNYVDICCKNHRLRAVLIFRRRSKYVLDTKFYAESNGRIHCFSETSYRAAI